ncbi:hypothetical protein EYC80_004568 [Monilinia laxa]|uniref:Macro domain-containing protein n=1 Tax=Monilinia laxa TaxID=61186 RepID=A0A5N6KHE7_MONLA|nr:hypothetical protein EYC80_004568 [Monilinia laxa]
MSSIGAQDEFRVISTSLYEGTIVEILDGDLLRYPVDVIVNTTSVKLRGGEDILHAAGPQLLQDMRVRFPHEGKVGGAYGTTFSYGIEACRYIIHAVGPDWGASAAVKDIGLLGTTYRNSLDLAVINKLRSISFPAVILVGFLDVSWDKVGAEILNTIRTWIDSNRGELDRISILSKALPKDIINQLHFTTLGNYIPNQGDTTTRDPPAAFIPIEQPDTTTSTLPVKSPTATAPPQPAKTVATTASPVKPRLIADLQLQGILGGTPDPPDSDHSSSSGKSTPPGTPRASPPPARRILEGRGDHSPSDSESSRKSTPPGTPRASPPPARKILEGRGNHSSSDSESSRNSTPPGTPRASPPPARKILEGRRDYSPSESDDDEPPYLLNFYEPHSYMWMGRDRYFALLEAGIDPETFVEGMTIPNPEEDSDDESLSGEGLTDFEEYHNERLDRGREISENLGLTTRDESPAESEAEIAVDAKRVKELSDKDEEQVKVALQSQSEQCTFLLDNGRCPVMCHPRVLRSRKIPGRCRIHQT